MARTSLQPASTEPVESNLSPHGSVGAERPGSESFLWSHCRGNQSCGLDQPTVVQSQLLAALSAILRRDGERCTSRFLQLQRAAGQLQSPFQQGPDRAGLLHVFEVPRQRRGQQLVVVLRQPGPANNYNLAAEKSVDGSDIPHGLVASYVYQLPIGRGKAIGSSFNRLTDAVIGGWEVSQIASFKQGIPISVSGANIASYGGNPRPDVVGNVHVSNPNIHEWFNTAAFAYAPYGTFGTAPRFFSYLRGPGYQNWDTSIMKNWGLRGVHATSVPGGDV